MQPDCKTVGEATADIGMVAIVTSYGVA